MKKKLYKVTVREQDHFALLTDYDAMLIGEYINGNRHGLDVITYADKEVQGVETIAYVDGLHCAMAAITAIDNLENYSFQKLAKELMKTFPEKTKWFEFNEKTGFIHNKNAGQFGYKIIKNKSDLIQFIFGNKLKQNTKTAKIKTRVECYVEAEVEVPDYFNYLDAAEYIKYNKDKLQLTGIHCDLRNIDFENMNVITKN